MSRRPGECGLVAWLVCDVSLSLLVFAQCEARGVYSAIEMIRDENLHRNIDDIYCTGGGAYKYAKLIEEQLAVRFHKVGWCV